MIAVMFWPSSTSDVRIACAWRANTNVGLTPCLEQQTGSADQIELNIGNGASGGAGGTGQPGGSGGSGGSGYSCSDSDSAGKGGNGADGQAGGDGGSGSNGLVRLGAVFTLPSLSLHVICSCRNMVSHLAERFREVATSLQATVLDMW